jgi:ribonuclease HII
LAIKNSIEEIIETLQPQKTIMDGNTTFGVKNVTAIVKADLSIKEVSAASILAKVSRDRFIVEKAKEYPLYGFEDHKGYGTKDHIAAIKKYGLCDLHRKSFKIKSFNQPTLF